MHTKLTPSSLTIPRSGQAKSTNHPMVHNGSGAMENGEIENSLDAAKMQWAMENGEIENSLDAAMILWAMEDGEIENSLDAAMILWAMAQ